MALWGQGGEERDSVLLFLISPSTDYCFPKCIPCATPIKYTGALKPLQ